MASHDSISIETVSTPSQRRDFFSVRRSIYKNDPAVVHPLASMERMLLDTSKHPFYKHASREIFVCYKNGNPVGRIAAIEDRMHNQQHGDRVGFFGFFEAIDDQKVIDMLLDAARQWLAARGCDAMRGPVNPSMKGEFGVLVEGHQYPATVMMGHSPLRYQRHLLDNGFESVREFYALRFRAQDSGHSADRWSHLRAARTKIEARYPQLQLRTVSPDNYEQTFRDINELGNVVRSEGWGFVPLTEDELSFMTNNLRRVIRFDMVHVAYWEDHLVGYIVNIPDVNWALKRARSKWDWLRMIQLIFLMRRVSKTRVIALGVDQAYRKKGIAMLLISKLVEAFDQYDEWEFSWVDSENMKSLRAIDRSVPLVKYKTYRLYQKSI